VHPLCTALRTRSVLSHPPGVKPQRPSPEIKQTPCKCTTTTYIYNIQRTHTDIHITQNQCRKNCSVILTMANACIYNGVPELSLALLNSAHLPSTTQNEISKSLLPEGLIERFPPGSPTLINYIQWLSSPASGSRSQPI
jgi:hypothetical protein